MHNSKMYTYFKQEMFISAALVKTRSTMITICQLIVIYSGICKTAGCGRPNNLCKVKMAVVLVKNSGWS